MESLDAKTSLSCLTTLAHVLNEKETRVAVCEVALSNVLEALRLSKINTVPPEFHLFSF